MATASKTQNANISGATAAKGEKLTGKNTLTTKARAEANLSAKKATTSVVAAKKAPAKTLQQRREAALKEAEAIRADIAKKAAKADATPALAPAKRAAKKAPVKAAKPALLADLPKLAEQATVPQEENLAHQPNIVLPSLEIREEQELHRRGRIAARMQARAAELAGAPVDPSIAGVVQTAEMHRPKSMPEGLHPVASDPSAFTADIGQITRSAPSLLYAASVMRPSLALAQGHALSLLQGLMVQVHEFTVAPDQARFQEQMTNLVSELVIRGQSKGFVVSVEAGYNRSKGRNEIATLRLLVRKGELAVMVVMFSGSTIMVHDMGGFEEGRFAIEKFTKDYEPREKGYIHHLTYVDGKIHSTRYENNDDGRFPDEAYPFLVGEFGGANAFVNNYIQSDTSILSLYGVAGTGKSVLMRKIATRSTGRTCMLVDNPIMYQDPNAAAALMLHVRGKAADGERPMLMLEEADEFIQQKDNAFLPQILSATSGVLKMDLKVQIATNLKNIDVMLHAMQRSGRSFGNVEFHRHTAEQAVACRRAFGLSAKEFKEGGEFSLADILTESVVNVGTNKRRTGFTN